LPPEQVVNRIGRHVIGNDVEDGAKRVRAEAVAELAPALASTKLRIDARVIDDVVAVRASGSSRVNGREVDVGDAELGEVRNVIRQVVQREAGRKLYTIRTGGHHVNEARIYRATASSLRRLAALPV